MGMQAAWENVGIKEFGDYAAIMLVVIGEAGEQHDGGTQVHMIGEEVGRLSDNKIADAGTDDADESAGDLRLDVAVVPGKARAYEGGGSAGGLKKERGIAYQGGGGIAIGDP